jgi:hypothetical protein
LECFASYQHKLIGLAEWFCVVCKLSVRASKPSRSVLIMDCLQTIKIKLYNNNFFDITVLAVQTEKFISR